MAINRAVPVTLAALLALGACAAVPPTGPSVMALPPAGKDLATFHADDASCRQYAAAQTPGSNVSAASTAALQQNYDIAYSQCMASKGNSVRNQPGPPIVVAYPPYPYPYWFGGPVFVGSAFAFRHFHHHHDDGHREFRRG